MRKLGQLGCEPDEARARLKRLIDPLRSPSIPLNEKQLEFVNDMHDALILNPDFSPTYGQVTYAQDLYDRWVV